VTRRLRSQGSWTPLARFAELNSYRARLAEIDEATAIAGRTRGWKPPASRLSAKQEQGIEEAVNPLRKKPGPLRVVDLVEEVAARCRLLRVPCPSRPAIDRRLKRSSGLKVHRRGVAAPGNADPKISPGSFIVHRPLDVVQILSMPSLVQVGRITYCYRCMVLNPRDVFSPYWRRAWAGSRSLPCQGHDEWVGRINRADMAQSRNLPRLLKMLERRWHLVERKRRHGF
jgi:hypothetical protein